LVIKPAFDGDSFIYDYGKREIVQVLYSLFPDAMNTCGQIIGCGFYEGI
jgi:hypothetical protein